jgi:hypothetical protein
MSAGLMCAHSSLGALPETSANWTHMYPFNENMQEHANMFYSVLKGVIEDVRTMDDDTYTSKIRAAKAYTDVFHNWELIRRQWEVLLQGLVNEPREIPKAQGAMFEYRV